MRFSAGRNISRAADTLERDRERVWCLSHSSGSLPENSLFKGLAGDYPEKNDPADRPLLKGALEQCHYHGKRSLDELEAVACNVTVRRPHRVRIPGGIYWGCHAPQNPVQCGAGGIILIVRNVVSTRTGCAEEELWQWQ